MTSKISTLALAIAATIVSACAGTQVQRSSNAAYVPRGQAAQPSSWNGPEAYVVVKEGIPAGRAAQPGSWPVAEAERAREPRGYATGIPAGQAAQPNAWIKTVY